MAPAPGIRPFLPRALTGLLILGAGACRSPDPGGEAARVIEGRILGAGGHGLPGGVVTARRSSPIGPLASDGGDDVEATTDARGRFRIETDAETDWLVVTRHPAGAAEVRPVPPEGREARLVILLGPGIPVGGIVLGPDGRPVPDARVSARATTRAGVAIPAPERESRTGPDGRFRLEHLTEGEKTVEVDAEGFSSARVTGVGCLASRPPDDLEIRLGPAQVLRGRVSDADSGRPVPGARVALHSTFDPGSAPRFATSGADGTFDVRTPPMEAFRAGFVLAHGHEPLVPRQETAPGGSLDLRLVELPRIAGRVVDDGTGAPVPEFSIGAAASDDPMSGFWPPGTEYVRDPDGRFDVAARRGEGVRLLVRAPGHAPRILDPVDTRAGDVRRLEVRLSRGTTVRGRVVDTAGRPVAGARIRIEGVRDPSPFFMLLKHAPPRYRTLSDRDGRFAIAHVLPGSREVTAEHSDHAPVSVALSVADGPESVIPDIALPRSASLWGSVLARDGGPDARAVVLVAAEDAATGPSRSVSTGPNGFYDLRNVRPGRYRLVVTQREGSTICFPRFPDGSSVELSEGERRRLDL